MMSRGRSPAASACTVTSPVARASAVRSALTAGGEAAPGSAIPSASEQADIVFAVYIPAHEPAPGQAARSTASRSASDMSPAAWAPTASNTSWIVSVLPSACPGRIVPPYRNAAGTFSLAHAISMPGSDLSQPAIATSASNRSACTISSTESAMTSRLTSDAFMPSWPIAIPSETAIVPNSIGTAPACRTPSLAARGEPVQVQVAGRHLVPRRGDGDLRQLQVVLAQPDRAQHRPLRRPGRSGGQRAAPRPRQIGHLFYKPF